MALRAMRPESAGKTLHTFQSLSRAYQTTASTSRSILRLWSRADHPRLLGNELSLNLQRQATTYLATLTLFVIALSLLGQSSSLRPANGTLMDNIQPTSAKRQNPVI